MARSLKTFDRWIPHEATSWSHQVLSKYDREMMQLWGTHHSSFRFTFSQLKKEGASLADPPGKFFHAGVKYSSFCSDLREWSAAYNLFDNWVNLGIVLSLASNIETYVASIVRLSIESDPGVLLGSSRSVEGLHVLKHGRKNAIDYSPHIEECTRGDWSKRLAAIEKIFGACPPGLRTVHADLEEMRKIRNRFGHAFGRDIDQVRRTGRLDTLPMEKLTRKRVERLRERSLEGMRALDRHLLTSHIGEFEAAYFYHRLYPTLHHHVSQRQRAQDLKKAIGGHGATPRGKIHCLGIVTYWEAL